MPAAAQLSSSQTIGGQILPPGEFYTSDENSLSQALVRHYVFDVYLNNISLEDDNGFYDLVQRVKKQNLRYSLIQDANNMAVIKSCHDCDENRLAVLNAYAEFLLEKGDIPYSCGACDVFETIIDPKKLFNLTAAQASKTEFKQILDKIHHFFISNWKKLRTDDELYAAAALDAIAPNLPPAKKKQTLLAAYMIKKQHCESYGCADAYIQNNLQPSAKVLKQPVPFKDMLIKLQLEMPQDAMHPEVLTIYAPKNRIFTTAEQNELKIIFEYLYGESFMDDIHTDMQMVLTNKDLSIKHSTWKKIANLKIDHAKRYDGSLEDATVSDKADAIRKQIAKDLGLIITLG